MGKPYNRFLAETFTFTAEDGGFILGSLGNSPIF
jgi:hypothetical protein